MREHFGYIISFAGGAVLCAALLNSRAQTPGGVHADQDSATVEVRALQQSKKNEPLHVRTARRVGADAVADSGAAALTHDTVECCLSVAEDIDQQLAARLRVQRAQDPDAFADQLQASGQRLMDLCELRTQDPALYNAKLTEMIYDVRVVELGAELCKAIDDKNEKQVVQLEQELRANLRYQLVFEIKSRGEFLIRLQSEVERIRAELDVMGGQFDTTVNTRLAELRDCTSRGRPSWQQRTRAIVPVSDPVNIPAE